MTTLSAPSKSGYEKTFETETEARAQAARLLDVGLDEMVEYGNGNGIIRQPGRGGRRPRTGPMRCSTPPKSRNADDYQECR